MNAYDQLEPWIQQFVDHYVAQGGDNAQAAFAKVKPNTKDPKSGGKRLMAMPLVIAAINERMTRRRELIELDEKWVLDRLRQIVDRCMQAEPVKDSKGEPTGEFKFDSSGANRALELIGKHFAMFTDKLKVSDLDDLTDDQLNERIRQAEREAGISATTH